MATQRNRRTPVVTAIATGTAELRPDPARRDGWTLLVDGVPQSYVDRSDPGHLEFPYIRQIVRSLRAWKRGATAVPPRVLHLGGGALTVPRLLAAEWPGVAQTVVELDPELIALVTREIPPAQPVEIIAGDAREALEAMPERRYDVIVADVFQGASTPLPVASSGFAVSAARVLRPGGLFTMNVTDVPPLAWTRIQVATLRSAFAEVALLGPANVVRGRRAGNVILLAGEAGAVPVVRPEQDERLLRAGEVVVFSGGARPRPDAL